MKNKSSVYNDINEFNEDNNISKDKKLKKRSFLTQIISIICAVFLWFYVSGVESSTYEKDFNSIDIELKNSDLLLSLQNFSVINGYNFTADVVLTGKKSSLNKLKNSDIEAYVDLSSITQPGSNELPVIINAPNGISVSSYDPMYVTVYVGKTEAKYVPIEVNANYSAPQQYILGDYKFKDDSGNSISEITVTGPENIISNITKAQVTLDFGAITGSVEARGKVVLLDSNNNIIESPYIRLNVHDIVVSLPVYMYKTVKLSVGQKYNTFSENQISYSLEPSVLTIKGDPGILEDIDEILVATIDETQIDETRSYQFTVDLPNGVENADTTSIIKVSANLNNVFTNTLSFTAPFYFDVTPPSSGLGYIITGDSLNIKLVGTTEHVLYENGSGLKIELDLSQYSEHGNYSAPINIKTQNNSTYHIVGYYNINVSITEKK